MTGSFLASRYLISTMIHPLITLAAVTGLIALLLGAFMTHTLESSITKELLAAFQTGVSYHMYHSLAMLAVSVLHLQFPHAQLLKLSAYSFLLGIILFSGSLYILALTDTHGMGIITPIGGVFLMLGWATLCLFGAKTNFQNYGSK